MDRIYFWSYKFYTDASAALIRAKRPTIPLPCFECHSSAVIAWKDIKRGDVLCAVYRTILAGRREMDWCARVLLMYALLCAAVLPVSGSVSVGFA